MTHQRTAIREGARALLAGYAPIVSAGVTVYKSRHLPVRPDKLPAMIVSIEKEETQETESAPRQLVREANLMIEVVAKGPADTDPTKSTLADSLDSLCDMVEEAIAQDESLGATVWDSVTSGTEMAFEEDGDQLVGVAQMVFATRYTTTLPKSTDGLDDFDSADIRYNLNGDQAEADQSQDILTDIHE